MHLYMHAYICTRHGCIQHQYVIKHECSYLHMRICVCMYASAVLVCLYINKTCIDIVVAYTTSVLFSL